MDIKIKETKKRPLQKPYNGLSQLEIIKKINQSTRNSYKLFELLWERK